MKIKDKQGMKLSPLQFWQWKAKIEEMLHAKARHELGLTQLNLMLKNIENEQLRASFHRNKVEGLKDQVELARKQYDEIKSKIEDEIGISLNDHAIDEVTFEVHALKEDEKK